MADEWRLRDDWRQRVDMNVVNTAFRVAQELGASPRVTLALFEAALVESGFRNLGHQGAANDHDSVGYLQQRPSQGWANPTDVPTATRSFVTKAKAKEAAVPGTAGRLAQAVQISAYPDRYDRTEPQARQLLGELGYTGAGGSTVDAGLPGSGLVEAVAAAAAALKEMAGGVTQIGALAQQAGKLALPSTALRIGAGLLGITLVFLGLIILVRQVKD